MSSYRLSPYQMDIMTMVSNGFTSRQIANKVGVKEQTVKNLKYRVMQKMKVCTGSHAVATLLRDGVIK